MKKVGLVSFAHESNSFNPNPTTRQMFKEGGVLFGKDIIREWSQSKHEIAGMIEQSDAGGTQIVPLVSAGATPAGPLEQEVYEEILREILTRLAGMAPWLPNTSETLTETRWKRSVVLSVRTCLSS